MKKNIFFIIVFIFILLFLLNKTYAASISSKEQFLNNIKLNSSVVSLSGVKYYIVGNSNEGVYPVDDSITLFRKDSSNNVTTFGYNTNYSDSYLIGNLAFIANNMNDFERKNINIRNFDPSLDNFSGNTIYNQYLWVLSSEEFNKLEQEVKNYDSKYWLRTAYYGDRVFGVTNGSISYGVAYYMERTVREALSLNLSSLYLVSDFINQNGKLSLNKGKLNSVENYNYENTNNLKFTFIDNSRTFKIDSNIPDNIEKNKSVEISYSNANVGENEYISVILKDNNGDIKYYGQIDNVSDSGSGTITLSFENVERGNYILEIFNEKINEDNISDISSNPYIKNISIKNKININSDIKNGNIICNQFANPGDLVVMDIKPELGYKLGNISVIDDLGSKITVENNSFVMGENSVVINATFIPEQYEFIEGENSVYQNTDMIFKLNGNLEILDTILINNNILDFNNYTLNNLDNNTVIILKDSYLKTLKNGNYEIKVTYKNGSFDITNFIIENNEKEEIVLDDTKQDNTIQTDQSVAILNPNTSDKILLYVVVLLVISISGFIISLKNNVNRKI